MFAERVHSIVHCGNSVGRRLVKNGAKMKRLGREMSEKKMAAVYRAVMIV